MRGKQGLARAVGGPPATHARAAMTAPTTLVRAAAATPVVHAHATASTAPPRSRWPRSHGI